MLILLVISPLLLAASCLSHVLACLLHDKTSLLNRCACRRVMATVISQHTCSTLTLGHTSLLLLGHHKIGDVELRGAVAVAGGGPHEFFAVGAEDGQHVGSRG